jgi:hypothetical protein
MVGGQTPAAELALADRRNMLRAKGADIVVGEVADILEQRLAA